jgi:hypothetical protein
VEKRGEKYFVTFPPEKFPMTIKVGIRTTAAATALFPGLSVVHHFSQHAPDLVISDGGKIGHETVSAKK